MFAFLKMPHCCKGIMPADRLRGEGKRSLDMTSTTSSPSYSTCWSSIVAKVNGRPGEEKNFYHQFSIEKYSSLPRDTFKTYVERHVTRRKLSLKLIGYCRQSSYTDSEVVFTLLPAVAWVLKSQFAPGYMHLNICFEGVSGKRGIFLNGK